jgi:hypothetical protein
MDPERAARNDALFRDANERIRSRAHELDVPAVRLPFLCECADRSCTQVVRLTPTEYEEVRAEATWFLHARGHEEAGPYVRVVSEHDEFVVVEKVGRAGEVATRLDPREDRTDGRA